MNRSEIYAGDFACGHEQTALHQRNAQIGTITDFLRWFDAARGGTEPAATSAPFAEARLTGQFKVGR